MKRKMESPSPNPTDAQNSDNSFVWDENSQLYFHAGSGFYHDPNAGWYYSTRDGLYYKYEDGNYVLIPSHEGESLETNNDIQVNDSRVDHNQEEQFSGVGNPESDAPEYHPPPSEWLEDTLIELYLSGYSNLEANAASDDMTKLEEIDDGNNDSHGLDGGEMMIPEDYDAAAVKSSENVSEEGGSWDEENWRAQYGQVIQTDEVPISDFSVISLWDWEIVTKSTKGGKGQGKRLLGRLAKQSAKLHPALPSGGGLLKTAPICEVHLDLVRVITGKIYKLRIPSNRYLATLSTYDSSNPTKDWGFPELSVNSQVPHIKSSVNREYEAADKVKLSKGSSLLRAATNEKHANYGYRDRAADRRALHGGFSIGPGQKNTLDDDSDRPIHSTEEAAAESLNMSFGVGSYGRKILEGMGWQEGKALGKNTKGLIEPIQAQGNIGCAGLGWPQGRLKYQ